MKPKKQIKLLNIEIARLGAKITVQAERLQLQKDTILRGHNTIEEQKNIISGYQSENMELAKRILRGHNTIEEQKNIISGYQSENMELRRSLHNLAKRKVYEECSKEESTGAYIEPHEPIGKIYIKPVQVVATCPEAEAEFERIKSLKIFEKLSTMVPYV